ncbi:GNAT family N-acetyltransferase [Epibacterium ulvae]|uniref:GNAT family N-acetyltransferase n=1 Tax=Epibacterium ulvae TaxID=1156985 RepID=UPI00249035AB|nr:GNAT family N-acetyltransferase [Epibacterium ulvae]
MVWRLAEQGDLSWIQDFLMQHAQSSMFLLSNLKTHGLGSDAPRALRVWIQEGIHSGVFAITNEGMVMPQASHANEAEWRAAAGLVAGGTIIGVLAEAHQARQFLKYASLGHHPCEVNRDEPGFALDLNDLDVPNVDGLELRPLAQAPRSLIVKWRRDYNVEILGAPQAEAGTRAEAEVSGFLARETHWALYRGANPVSMCGINAQAGPVVQIGGVYTPPDLRSQGLARCAVALMLRHLHHEGVQRAVLFAASDAAAKAYTSLGFQRNGSYALVVFASPTHEKTATVEKCT